MPVIQEHVEILDRMRAFWDGDSICVVLDTFIDLQSSPAHFIAPGELHFDTLAPWVGAVENPSIHLPHSEWCDIAKILLRGAK